MSMIPFQDYYNQTDDIGDENIFDKDPEYFEYQVRCFPWHIKVFDGWSPVCPLFKWPFRFLFSVLDSGGGRTSLKRARGRIEPGTEDFPLVGKNAASRSSVDERLRRNQVGYCR